MSLYKSFGYVIAAVVLVIGLVAVYTTSDDINELDDDVIDLFNSLLRVETHLYNDITSTYNLIGFGSGVIIYEDELSYYGITCYHVVDGVVDRYEIVDNYNNRYIAEMLFDEYLELSDDLDLALFKFDKSVELLVSEISIDYDLADSVTSVKNRIDPNEKITYGSITNIFDWLIIHNARTWGGNSGSGIYNSNNELIGITAQAYGTVIEGVTVFTSWGAVKSENVLNYLSQYNINLGG